MLLHVYYKLSNIYIEILKSTETQNEHYNQKENHTLRSLPVHWLSPIPGTYNLQMLLVGSGWFFEAYARPVGSFSLKGVY